MGFILFMFCGMLLLGGMFWYSDRKNRALFLEKLRQDWGRPPGRSYTAEQIERLSAYGRYRSAQEPFAIDRITWEDLDMDKIFARMDHTVSAPGREYLLYLLRTPMLEEGRMWERDRLIRLFAQDEEMRL